MKKLYLTVFILILALLFSCCSKPPTFDDAEKQLNFEAIADTFEKNDWDALNSSLDWDSMRHEAPVKALAAAKLRAFHKADDWQNACALLTHMNYDFAAGGEYYGSYDFMSWMVSSISGSGEHFIKENGIGGYYDTHSAELSEFTNYDESTGTEYISKVWYQGDFALNVYTVQNRETGELAADHTLGLYLRGICISNTSDSTQTINGEAVLKGFVTNGSYYTNGGYLLCNTGSSCLESFTLIPEDSSGYCIVRTQSTDYSGKQYKIG